MPQVWLEEEARNSPCPHSLLATWKGARGGVPSYVMIKLLRRRLAESCPEGMKTPLPPIRLQRAQDTLRQIWTLTGGGGERHPVWHLVEAVLRMASDHARAHQVKPDECVVCRASATAPFSPISASNEGASVVVTSQQGAS